MKLIRYAPECEYTGDTIVSATVTDIILKGC